MMEPTPRKPAPQLEEPEDDERSRLRAGIEQVDRALIALIAERVRLAGAIGAAKRAAGLAVLDPAREASVVRRAAALAREAGLADDDVRHIIWHLIGLCRRAQMGMQPTPAASESVATVRAAAVVGLGLMGGSFARDLAIRGVRVLGYDRDAASLQAAIRAGVVQAPLEASLAGIEEGDVVVLAVPVSAAPELLATARPHLGRARLVTDLGSTKRTIVAAAESLGIGERFVGSHPLVGDHRSGWEAARTGLFSGGRVYLCPSGSTRDDALELARALWCALDAHPEVIAADAHDRQLAWSSHLPQAASTALSLSRSGMLRWDSTTSVPVDAISPAWLGAPARSGRQCPRTMRRRSPRQ